MDLPYIVGMSQNESKTESLSQNESKTESRDVYLAPIDQDLGMAIPYLIIISLALLSGSVGNCLVIASVIIDKELRTVGNLFIVNLAIADLCVTGFVDPFSVVGIVRGEKWFFNKGWLCEAVASICLTSCFCSLLSIGAISFNRYIHICHDSYYKKIYTLPKTICMCLGLWIISFLAEMPNFIGWGDHVYDKKTLSCVWDRTADLSYTIFFSSVGVLFPIILISICYLKIYLFVRQSKSKVGHMRSKTNDSDDATIAKEKKESVRLARTLFLIFVLFAACWVPYAIVVVADVNDTFPTAVHSYAVAIAHANSSLNSILYGVTNRHFRNSYFRILRIDKCLNRRLLPSDFSHSTHNSTVSEALPPRSPVKRTQPPKSTVALTPMYSAALGTLPEVSPVKLANMKCRGPYIRDQ